MKIKILLLALIISSCKNKNEDKFTSCFDQTTTYSIKSKPVKLQESELVFSSMFKISYIDHLLLVSEIKDPEYEMKIVDLKKGTIRNLGRRGNGPDEIKYRGSNFSIEPQKKTFCVIDGNNYLVYRTDSIKDNKDLPFSRFTLDVKEGQFMESTYFNGNVIGGLHDKRFGLYNVKSKRMIEKYSYAKTLPKGALNNQAFFLNHPVKNLAAYFYYKSAIFGIITISDNDINVNEKIYWKTDNEEILDGHERKITHKKDQFNGFISSTASDKYIYVLYSGKSLNVKSLDELTEAYLSKYVYVFDWKGNPVKKYELDQEVRSIAIDQNDATLYAGSYKNNEPHLIQFNLKN